MKSLRLNLILTSAICGVIIVAILLFARKTPTLINSNNKNFSNTTVLSSTSFLDIYHQAHLTTEQSKAIISNLQNEKKFIVTKDYSLVGDCGRSANADIFKLLNAQRKVQVINQWYPILWTPNLQHWSILEANEFMKDPTITCGVGFFYPFEVTADHILWRPACSSGAVFTDANGSPDTSIVRCIQAQEVISKEYHLQD